MRELTFEETDLVAGGIGAVEGATLIVGLVALAPASVVVVGIGLGAATGLIIANVLATRSDR